VAEILHMTPTSPHSEALSGLIAGRFMIVERLGKGGMGEVYRAEDVRLKRTVALKRLAPQLRNDPHYRRRFQQEAERVSSFSDAHIAALYDVIEADGEMLLIMEFVEGETLRQRMQQAIGLEEFFTVAAQCAEALAAAHARGVVHCDIKPENIMLTRNEQVKILDFGVAKYLPRSDQSTTVDRSGPVGGTPAYMAPEVLLEKIPDGRADIFSLGIVFYEILTGQHPFLASSFVATTDRIRNETPASIRIFNRHASAAVESITTKMLAKDPAQRYASADELLADLRLAQAGMAPAGLKPATGISSRARRWRWPATAAGAVLVVIVVFAVYHSVPRKPILAERGWVLITDFDTRGEDVIRDEAVREGLTIALQQSRYVNVFPRSRVYDVLQRMKKEKVTRIDENLGREICQRENLQVLITGSIEHVGDVFQITLRALEPQRATLLFSEKERFNRKEEFFEKTDALARATRRDLGESLAGINTNSRPLAKVTTNSLEALQLYSQAKDASDQGDNERVLSLLRGALQLDPDFAMAHLKLAEYYASVVSKNENALQEYKRAYDLRRGVTDRERRWIEADYYSSQERYEDAAQALSILANLYPDDADVRAELADAYYAVGQLDKAIEQAREAIRLDPHGAQEYGTLTLFLARNNQDDEAIRTYQQAAQQGMDLPNLHWGLGMAYLGKGDVARARKQFQLVEDSGTQWQSLGDLYLARTDLYQGKVGAARSRLEAALQRDQARPGKGLQFVERALLGDLEVFAENPVSARQQADAIASAVGSNLQTSDYLAAGIIYARSGELGRARQLLQQLDTIQSKTPTAWNQSSDLCLEGEIALEERKPAQAVKMFSEAESKYSRALFHAGLAKGYEMQKDWEHAIGEWEEVLRRRGEMLQDQFPPDLAVAELQLARDNYQNRNFPASKQHYQAFLELWREADSQRLLKEAGRELKQVDNLLVEHPPTAGKLRSANVKTN
jgi:eukaryotic-like serine/threonine-protein kinase